jgi:hypothetical protein
MRAGRSTCRAAQTAITVTRPRPSAHHAPHRVAPYPSLPLRSTGGHPGGRAGAPSGTAAKAGTWAVTEGEHSPTVSYTYLARTARYGVAGRGRPHGGGAALLQDRKVAWFRAKYGAKCDRLVECHEAAAMSHG